MIRVDVDDREVEAAFAGLLDMGPALSDLEQVLSGQFAATDAHVHIITGSLRGSGDVDSDFAGGAWIGQIQYGGPSPGFPNDPVEYAIYEYARGGRHNFMEPAVAQDSRYGVAVRRHLARG